MSLKTEMIGLATIAELPLVVVNVQRGGPSTGIPTKSEQSDLFQAAFSAHGDAARPVLAPMNVADTFPVTVEAFNIAERYQTPVIILSDQEIAQRKEAIDRPVTEGLVTSSRAASPTETELENYVRFRMTESGISPISHPGMKGGNYLASGIEHTESGAPTADRLDPREDEREAAAQAEPAQEPRATCSSWTGPPTRRWRSSRGVPRPGIVLEALDAGPAVRPAGEGAGPAAALPGRRGGLPRLLRLGEARPRRRAVAPGAALSAHPDVRRTSRRGSSRSRRAGRTRSARPRSSSGCARSRARSSRSASRSARRSKTGIRLQESGNHGYDQPLLLRPARRLTRRRTTRATSSRFGARVRRLRRRAGDLPRARRHRAARRTRSRSSRASAAPAASPATPRRTASTRSTAARCPSRRASSSPAPTCSCSCAGGDGDGFSIGGGHVAHAIRRNIDLTYIIMDNQIYGLTKGQLSPTSPRGLRTASSSYGSMEDPVNPLLYVLGYGCRFVAQGTPADMAQLAVADRGRDPLPGVRVHQRPVAVRHLRRGETQLKAQKQKMQTLASLGHDPSDRIKAMDLAQHYGGISTQACSTATRSRRRRTAPTWRSARRRSARARSARRCWTSSSRRCEIRGWRPSTEN